MNLAISFEIKALTPLLCVHKQTTTLADEDCHRENELSEQQLAMIFKLDWDMARAGIATTAPLLCPNECNLQVPASMAFKELFENFIAAAAAIFMPAIL